LICVLVHKRSWRDPGPVVNVGVHNAAGYAAAGFETHLVVGRGEESDTDADLRAFYGVEPQANLHIHRVARKSLLGADSTLPIFWFATGLIRRLAQRDDVVAVAREPSFLPYLAFAGRNPRVRTCFEAHNFYADLSWRTDGLRIQDRHQSWLEQLCLPRITGIAAIVAPLAALYAKRFPHVRTETLPLGTEPVAPGDPEARRLLRRAVYVGHLHTKKGLKNLIDAARPAEGGLHVGFWGGADEQVKKLHAKMVSEGRADRIEFSAFRPPEELQRDLATKASVGIVALHHTYYNANLTCPAKALDYLSHGLPIIATDLPSIRSLLGEAAIYVPPDDTPALRAALLALLDDPAEYRRRSALSLSRAQELAWPERARRLVKWLSD
jgi:glycosyltransferase involved in cell wall biosynthesis